MTQVMCGATNCFWNDHGLCDNREIVLDFVNGVGENLHCASYMPVYEVLRARGSDLGLAAGDGGALSTDEREAIGLHAETGQEPYRMHGDGKALRIQRTARPQPPRRRGPRG